MEINKLTVIGLGYIGLPTAALASSCGMSVTGVDINKDVVDIINEGKIHIVEPDLEGLVNKVVKSGNLKASIKPEKADVFMISVPTPFKENHKPDLTFVQQAAESIIPYIESGNLVVLESTSPVATTERTAEQIFKARPELKGKIRMAYCPERVLPGNILYELKNNARIIGGLDQVSSEMAEKFYSKFVTGEIVRTNARTAEMCKLVENSYRDVNIAFANEISMLADRAGIDTRELISLTNRHPRVKILNPGPGVGGHCIAVDPWFLVADYPETTRMIHTAREVNEYKRIWVVEKIKLAASDFEKSQKRKPVIACMGLSYKADIDDMRESPSVEIYNDLHDADYQVLAVEPNVEKHKSIELISPAKAVEQADILVFLVSHKSFRTLDWDKNKVVLDYCGFLLK